MTLRFSDILHLLVAYEGVVSARPLEMGNAEFLSCLLNAARSLGQALSDAPRNSNVPPAEMDDLLALVQKQTPSNAKRVAARILTAAEEIRKHYPLDRSAPDLYIRGPLPALRRDYTKVTVIFGHAMGLGDQISFFELLKALKRHCQTRLTIFTLYPNVWRYLMPGADELHYRAKPLKPFHNLDRPGGGDQRTGRELVVVADFECFDLHKKVIPHHPNRDILEIALGRRAVWLNQGNSPWMHFESFFSEPIMNNYWMLGRIAARLFPESASGSSWQSLGAAPAPRRRSHTKTIFLNPFSSKHFPLGPKDWHALLQKVRAQLDPAVEIQVLIYSGLDEGTCRYAADICRLCVSDEHPIPARLMQGKDDSPLTAFSAVPTLIQALQTVDLCITVDTFTAHLVPLFQVPTAIITLRDNREFWVPGRWSFYCLLDRFESLPTLLLHLLTVGARLEARPAPNAQTARSLVKLTLQTDGHGLTPSTLRQIQESLALTLRSLSPRFPYRSQAQSWLLLWSRVALALDLDPVDRTALQPYIFQWRESEFFKLLAFQVEAEYGSVLGVPSKLPDRSR